MYLLILMTILVSVSVVYGVTLLIPKDPEIQPPSIPDELKDTSKETPEETSVEEKPIESGVPQKSFSSDCYDKITERSGRVYLFKSQKPLQEGSNPKVFSDLPSYRVWAEQELHEGIRCPILFLKKGSKYKHPEEKYPEEIPIVNAKILEGQRRKYEATITYTDPGTGFTNKPYLQHPPTSIDEYEYNLYKRTETDEENFKSSTRTQKNQKLDSNVRDPVRHVGHDDLIEKSRYEALDLGADQTLPIPPRNFRDVPEEQVVKIIEKQDPYFKGAELTRIGTSKYEITEIQPERESRIQDDIKNEEQILTNSNVPIDLLAYGGTVVPVGSVHGII